MIKNDRRLIKNDNKKAGGFALGNMPCLQPCTKKALQNRALQCVKKVAAATFLRNARSHRSLRSRAFDRVRKRFCKQNRAKIAAHVADFR